MTTKVLLVEDDPGTVDVMSVELQFLGYAVTVASDGAEAVEKALAEVPDIILMDIRLPKLDGFQALTSIRANPKTRSIPLLAVTAMVAPGFEERCLAAGFQWLYRQTLHA
jgi:CheY-like chemotaxis protein